MRTLRSQLENYNGIPLIIFLIGEHSNSPAGEYACSSTGALRAIKIYVEKTETNIFKKNGWVLFRSFVADFFRVAVSAIFRLLRYFLF
jgi:hypothetical protein